MRPVRTEFVDATLRCALREPTCSIDSSSLLRDCQKPPPKTCVSVALIYIPRAAEVHERDPEILWIKYGEQIIPGPEVSFRVARAHCLAEPDLLTPGETGEFCGARMLLDISTLFCLHPGFPNRCQA